MTPLLFVLALIGSTIAQSYNGAQILVGSNITCALTPVNSTYPTYKLQLNAQISTLNRINVPYVNCVGTASTATVNAINNWTLTTSSSGGLYTSIVSLETLNKCFNPVVNSTFSAISVAINYNVSVILTGLLTQSDQCKLNLIYNTTGTTTGNYSSGSMMYTADLTSTTWINNNTQLQFSIQTCIVKPLGLNAYLRAPVAATSGDGYNITFSATVATCLPYPGQDGCCQTWTGVTDRINASSANWAQRFNFYLYSDSSLYNGSEFYVGFNLTVVKPTVSDTTVPVMSASANLFGDAGLTVPASTVYNRGRVYAMMKLDSVLDCNTYVLSVDEVDVCYSGVLNTNINGCSDPNAVVETAYLKTGMSAASQSFWDPVMTFMPGCKSQMKLNWYANILGPNAMVNSSIPMYVKINYSYSKQVGYGFAKRRITSEPLTVEYFYNVACEPGSVWNGSTCTFTAPSYAFIIIPLAILLTLLLPAVAFCIILGKKRRGKTTSE